MVGSPPFMPTSPLRQSEKGSGLECDPSPERFHLERLRDWMTTSPEFATDRAAV
jgi:hypothetical protein